MTVLTATKPLSLTGAGIASVLDIFDTGYNRLLHTGAEYKVSNLASNVLLDFKSVPGHPFTYGLGPTNPPTGGNIASLQIKTDVGLTLAYSLTAMNVSVLSLVSDVTQNKWGAVLKLFFGGNDTITGSNQNQAEILAGFGGNDRITGRGGNDTSRGGAGNDTFVFKLGFGHDTIADFTAGATAASPHDKIELHSILGLGNFAAVMNHTANDVGGHAVITATSGDSITLNVAKAALHGWDFAFLA